MFLFHSITLLHPAHAKIHVATQRPYTQKSTVLPNHLCRGTQHVFAFRSCVEQRFGVFNSQIQRKYIMISRQNQDTLYSVGCNKPTTLEQCILMILQHLFHRDILLHCWPLPLVHVHRAGKIAQLSPYVHIYVTLTYKRTQLCKDLLSCQCVDIQVFAVGGTQKCEFNFSCPS